MTTGYKIYDQNGVYYLTLQVVDWLDTFSRKEYRDIVIESVKFCQEKKGLRLHAYVIMSNHVHLIASAANVNLSDVIRDFKRFTSTEIIKAIQHGSESRKEWLLRQMEFAAKRHKRNNQYQLWTHENHAVELTSNKFIDQKLNYIHENPVRAGLVEQPHHWLYSSARNYSGMQGLVKIDLLE